MVGKQQANSDSNNSFHFTNPKNPNPKNPNLDLQKSHITCFHFRTSHFDCKEWLFCTIIFENHNYFKILAKFVFCLLLNYTNMLNCRFIYQQTSQEINQWKRMIVCFEIFALLFSKFARSFISRIRFCCASGSDIYNILIIYIYMPLNCCHFETAYTLHLFTC
jgi:hypothetical protein